MNYNGPKFTKEQLIFIAQLPITAAWDRIQSSLPGFASNKAELRDYNDRKKEILTLIHGYKLSVAAALPILYASLTNDGLGIGEFPQFDEFENQVEEFIAEMIDPQRNCPDSIADGTLPRHPSSLLLAESFVSQFLSDYYEA